MRILFLCPDNGARSQMAAALARSILSASDAPSAAEIFSAGLTAGRIGAFTADIMQEAGLQAGQLQTQVLNAADVSRIDLLVSVCERDLGRDLHLHLGLPALPATLRRLHWPLVDPHSPPANPTELKQRLRDTRLALDKHIRTLKSLKIRRTA